MTSSLLSVSDLHVHSASGIRILDGVSLALGRGEVLGLVGESGCGKSMTCYALADLLPTGLAVTAGTVTFDGADVKAMTPAQVEGLRGGRIAMIFQDPTRHLNPVHRIGAYLEGALRRHRGLVGRDARLEAMRLLERVGIQNSGREMDAYPHQFSGGMNQRVMIAHALACQPDLLIADEPTTALDVTTQAQILDLLEEVRAETGMAMLLVSHDLGVIARLADRIAVMYCGRVVESAPVADLFGAMAHPYARALIDCIPSLEGDDPPPPQSIPGFVPPLSELPDGCHFHPRCARATDRCRFEVPARQQNAPRHETACFHPGMAA